jgi:hypothetical protein
METAICLKVVVVGPSRTGKTLLCRALAEQPVMPGEYTPTAAVRCEGDVRGAASMLWIHKGRACGGSDPRPRRHLLHFAFLRIQEFSRTLGVDRVKVQLWDCSGSSQYQAYWGVLGKVSQCPPCGETATGMHGCSEHSHGAPNSSWIHAARDLLLCCVHRTLMASSWSWTPQRQSRRRSSRRST